MYILDILFNFKELIKAYFYGGLKDIKREYSGSAANSCSSLMIGPLLGTNNKRDLSLLYTAPKVRIISVVLGALAPKREGTSR